MHETVSVTGRRQEAAECVVDGNDSSNSSDSSNGISSSSGSSSSSEGTYQVAGPAGNL